MAITLSILDRFAKFFHWYHFHWYHFHYCKEH